MSKQRGEDFWEPAPALANRVSAAVGSWGARRIDLYDQIRVADTYGRGHDKEFWEIVSDRIAEMEDCFASILEQLVPTDNLTVKSEHLLPKDDHDGVVTTLVVDAKQGLTFTKSCRREIGAGRAAAAALEMHMATQCYFLIRAIIHYDAAEPHLARSFNYKSGHKLSENTRDQNKLEEYRRWLEMDLELSRDNPHWNKTGRAQEIGERVKRSPSRVLSVLKKLREEENDPTANS